jgi:DNA-binding NtrC family response regulator
MHGRGEGGDLPSFGELIGRSASMRALFVEGARLAAAASSLSICGEAGSGKDALARAVHRASSRAHGPLLSVDCSAPPAALEAELFGRAAGALGTRAGALELAHGGTLLLDHAGELPSSLQGRLLEALTSRSLRTEDGRTRALDLRPIALHRRKLAYEVERGRLLPALLRALAGAELSIAPLRERRDDIALLAQHLLGNLAEGRGLSWSSDALELLSLHDWPGNVRELRNVVERFVYALRAGEVGARRVAPLLLSGELPASERRDRAASDTSDFEPGVSYREERARCEADFERRYVGWLLDRHDGNLSAAARAAEMDRKYLDKLARKHQLKPLR